jgi:hypothetical protein
MSDDTRHKLPLTKVIFFVMESTNQIIRNVYATGRKSKPMIVIR